MVNYAQVEILQYHRWQLDQLRRFLDKKKKIDEFNEVMEFMEKGLEYVGTMIYKDFSMDNRLN